MVLWFYSSYLSNMDFCKAASLNKAPYLRYATWHIEKEEQKSPVVQHHEQ